MIENISYHQKNEPWKLRNQIRLVCRRFWNYYMMEKAEKQPKTHIFLENKVFLGQMVAFNNLFYHKTIRYCISDENTQVRVILQRIIWPKRRKNSQKHIFRRKCVFRAQILAIR